MNGVLTPWEEGSWRFDELGALVLKFLRHGEYGVCEGDEESVKIYIRDMRECSKGVRL